MQLIPSSIAATIPALYAQDGKGMNATAYVKIFHPLSGMTHFVTEYDPDERLAFGYTENGQDSEFGYMSIDEFEQVRVQGLAMERDLNFMPQTLADAVAEIKA